MKSAPPKRRIESLATAARLCGVLLYVLSGLIVFVALIM